MTMTREEISDHADTARSLAAAHRLADPTSNVAQLLDDCANGIDQLLSELDKRASAQSEWLPIETALKDGTKIIGGQFYKGELRDVALTWWGDSSRIYDPILGLFKQSEWWLKRTGSGYFDPTHWIPQPPTEEAEA